MLLQIIGDFVGQLGQEKTVVVWEGEFGRFVRPAMDRIHSAFPLSQGRLHHFWGKGFHRLWSKYLRLLHSLLKLICVFPHAPRIFCVQLTELGEDFHPLGLGKIGASVDRSSVGQCDAVQWPPASPGHQLDRGHIHLVDVWPFLSVDLDRHKMLVHQAGHRLVLKGFVLHDMTPVTGRIANADDHQFIFCFGRRQSLLVPGLPMHRISLMLEQIRAA